MDSSHRAWRILRGLGGNAVLILLCVGPGLLPGCPTATETGPAANFFATPYVGPAPLSVQFRDFSMGGDELITQWSWLFGDGGTSTEQNPAHIYTVAGTYNVSLTVTTKAGSNTLLETGFITVTDAGEIEEGEPDTEGEGEGDTGTVFLPGNVPLNAVFVPAGSFLMGSPDAEQDRTPDEGPQHQVTITRGFWIGQTEVTKAQWQAVTGTEPWSGQNRISTDPASPAVWIPWSDANAFIAALNTLTGKSFRLPTEAEWEFACRAGTTTRYSWGDDANYQEIFNEAWWSGNAWDLGDQFAHGVALKLPSSPGLFDMSGNAWEWCADWYGSYTAAPATDPTGPAAGAYRAVRGGGAEAVAKDCRSARRGRTAPALSGPTLGFRVVRN